MKGSNSASQILLESWLFPQDCFVAINLISSYFILYLRQLYLQRSLGPSQVFIVVKLLSYHIMRGEIHRICNHHCSP